MGFRLFELLLAVLATHFAWRWGLYLPRLQEVVLPLGLAQYIDLSLFFREPWGVVNAAFITTLIVTGFFRIHRAGYLGAIFFLHLQYAARFSQGEIPHSQNGVGLMLLVFAIGTFFFHRPALQQRFTMASAYLFMGVGYTSAAVCKLVATGWTWPDGRHLWLWVHEKSIDVFSHYGTLGLNVVQEMVLEYWWLATAFLLIGLISEVIAVSMAFRGYRVVAVAAVIGLHAGIYVTMDILFSHTTILLIGLFLYLFADRLDRLVPAGLLDAAYRFLYPKQVFSQHSPRPDRLPGSELA